MNLPPFVPRSDIQVETTTVQHCVSASRPILCTCTCTCKLMNARVHVTWHTHTCTYCYCAVHCGLPTCHL